MQIIRSLKDSASIQNTCKEIETWMSPAKKSGLPAREVQGLDLPVFHLASDPVASAGVHCTHNNSKAMDRKISSYLRGWLSLPRSLSSTGSLVWH